MIEALGERVEVLEDQDTLLKNQFLELNKRFNHLEERCNHESSGVVELEFLRQGNDELGFRVIPNPLLIRLVPGSDGLSTLPGEEPYVAANMVVPADQAADLLAADVPPPYEVIPDIPM